jgi:hypothetical protein
VHTEEDTFRTLKRIPISELDFEYRERMWEFYSKPKVFNEWLEKNGWTESAFFDAGSKYEKSLRR